MNENELLLEIMIRGVSVYNENYLYEDLKNSKLKRFRRFDFYYEGYRYSTYMESSEKTPFLFKSNNLYYNNGLVENICISRIINIDWGSEKPWYIKTWNQSNITPFELRLNPINICYNLKNRTGENGEFRGCAFCHRVYTHVRHAENRQIVNIEEMFKDIFAKEGSNILSKIKKVLIMTGNAKNAKQLLDICKEIHSILNINDFRGVFSVSTNQFKTEDYIKELAQMDNYIFDYTLEIFDRRHIIMGNDKGYDFQVVKNVLNIARKYFKKIRVTYVVGLDNLKSLEMGFSELKKLNLIDDVIPLIFVPYTPEMKALRCNESQSIDYYFAAQEILASLSLVPQKNGLSKDLFLEHKLKNKKMDSLLE